MPRGAVLVGACLVGALCGTGARAAPASPGVAWPAAVPKPTGLTSSKVEKLQRGQQLVAFSVTGNRDQVWTAWLAGFRAAGWTVIDEHGWHGDLRSASVRLGPLRAYIHLSHHQQKVGGLVRTVVPPRIPVKLGGKCVKIPEQRFHIYVHPNAGAPIRSHHQRGRTFRPKSLYYGYRTRFEFDLDGDGLLDALVPLHQGAYCPKSVKRAVYIVRGRCGYHLGTVDGGWLDPELHRTEPRPRGLKDIGVSHHYVGGPPKGYRKRRRRSFGPQPHMWNVKQTFRFERGRYRKHKESRSGGRCHHCRMSTCTGPINARTCDPRWPDRLPQAAQKPVFDKATRAARSCFARLKLRPTKIVWVDLKVAGRTGRATSAKILYKSAPSPAIRRCVLHPFRKLQFPRFCDKELWVSFPVKPR
ncbi:MAG: hypothetical protein ABI333_27405 [bacterium]